MPKAITVALRLLALFASAACGSLVVVQLGLFFSSRAEGSWFWVALLSLIGGFAAMLLVVRRSPAVGAAMGLVVAVLGNELWSTGPINNRILASTEGIALPLGLLCGFLLAAAWAKRFITRGGEPTGAVVLDRSMATALLTTHDWPCAKCAYNLRGNLSGVCPECTTPVELMLAASRGATPVVLLRVVLLLLMTREVAGLYHGYTNMMSLLLSPPGGGLTSNLIWVFSADAGLTKLTLMWAGLVLARSFVTGKRRMTDRRLIVETLGVLAFSLATQAVLSVLYVLV